MNKLEGWKAKEEGAKETSLSIGRKPLPILHPEDVAKLKAVTLKPVPTPITPRQDVTETVPITAKLYLTVKEAAAYSGLPESYLRRCLQAKVLLGVKIGGWRIRRADLFSHKAEPVLIEQYEQKLLA